MEMSATQANEEKQQSNALPMIIVAGLFFILGFATWLNGSLMPYLKQILQLSPFEASLILFSFYIAVTFTALPSATIIRKVGYKNGMALGMATMMVAGLLFIPAAKTQVFALFLFAQLIMGTGITLLQTAVNPYVVRIGPEESAAARISIMGILNKGAGVVAPMVFTALILSGFQDVSGELSQVQINEMANSLVLPYLGMAVFLGLLAIAVKKSPLPELESEEDTYEGTDGEEHQGHLKEALSHPNLVLGVVALFFYVAAEVIAGDTIGTFALSLGVANYTMMTSYTMICMVAGYILGIALIPKFISQQNALMVSAIIGLILTAGIVFGDNNSFAIANAVLGGVELPDTLVLIACLGFANAIVWPAVFPLALSGMGKLTSIGSALLVMGISGGAFGPLFWSISSTTSMGEQGGYLVLIPCYLFILFYAVKGCKMKSWQ